MRGTHIPLIHAPNPLASCTHSLFPSFFSDNPVHPSPLNHAQEKMKDMCLQYQQTLIWCGFAEVGSGYPLSELANGHIRIITQFTYIRTLTGPLSLLGKHTPHLARQIDYTLRNRQKDALWNSNIASPLHACKHLQGCPPHYWFHPLPSWSLLQAHQWHTRSATMQVPTSEWALLGEGHWTVLREEPDHAGQWGSEEQPNPW